MNSELTRVWHRALRVGMMPMLALSHCVMWLSAGTVLAASPIQATVSQENITISLPVFFTAVCMTAVCTWTVAKYDHSRNDKIKRLERVLDALVRKLALDDDDVTRTPPQRDRGRS